MMVPKVMNSIVNYGVKAPVKALSNTKVMNWVCDNYQNNNTRFIMSLGIFSIVLKDGMGCYLYVKQSLNNKKIPEDKRKFVAALDLANGGLMIATQLITAVTLSNPKIQAKLFNSSFGRLFDRPARKGYQTLIKQSEKFKSITGKDFNMTFSAFRSKMQDTFGILSTLVASTILAKRVVVPFIATPLAESAKKVLYSDTDTKSANAEKK